MQHTLWIVPIAALLIGCNSTSLSPVGEGRGEGESPPAAQTVEIIIDTPAPEPTMQPTSTIEPTATTRPTLTPVPSAPPSPTRTKQPAATRTPASIAPTVTPRPPEPTRTWTPAPQPANCDAAYPDFCIPAPPPDLDCKDVAPHKRFRVLPPDPHDFDRDGNGLGCES